MRAQHGELVRTRLSVGERRKQRREPVALAAALDRRYAAQERLPALGEQPIHLRVGPPGQLADLPVRVALGLQQERADLVRLQPRQRLGSLAQFLEPLGLVVRDRRRGGAVAQVAVIGDRRVPLALAAQGEGLMLDDCLKPRDELFLARRRGLREQDLEAALVGVLRVLGCRRVAACGREDLGAVAPREAERRLVDLAPCGPRPWLQHLHDAQPGWCYSSPLRAPPNPHVAEFSCGPTTAPPASRATRTAARTPRRRTAGPRGARCVGRAAAPAADRRGRLRRSPSARAASAGRGSEARTGTAAAARRRPRHQGPAHARRRRRRARRRAAVRRPGGDGVDERRLDAERIDVRPDEVGQDLARHEQALVVGGRTRWTRLVAVEVAEQAPVAVEHLAGERP